MIYLASPYTHKDPRVEHARYLATMAACASYMMNGEHVYSPIVHWHNCANIYELPTDADFWKEHNMHMLAKADSLHILRLDGYLKSKGLQAELEEAKRLGIEVMATSRDTLHVCNELCKKLAQKPSYRNGGGEVAE